MISPVQVYVKSQMQTLQMGATAISDLAIAFTQTQSQTLMLSVNGSVENALYPKLENRKG